MIGYPPPGLLAAAVRDAQRRTQLAQGDGVSFQTKRAMLENGVIPVDQPAAPAPAAPAYGGPSPSADLQARVRAAQAARAAAALQRLLAERAALAAPDEDRPLRGGRFR